MDGSVESGCEQPSPWPSQPLLPAVLDKTAPEDLLSGTDDERNEQSDPDESRSPLESKDRTDVIRRRGKNCPYSRTASPEDCVKDQSGENGKTGFPCEIIV